MDKFIVTFLGIILIVFIIWFFFGKNDKGNYDDEHYH